MLYFIIALLDKWISLIDGGSLTGLTSSNKDLRMPVGFGLAYYLIGAVLLDFNAHRLYEIASRSKEDVVPTDGDIHSAALVKSHNRKTVYWLTLGKYLLWHVWGLAGTITLVWVFTSQSSVKPTIIFLSYVLAYTGLLWYQVSITLPTNMSPSNGFCAVHEGFLRTACPETNVNWSICRPASGIHSSSRISSLRLHGHHRLRRCNLDCGNPLSLGWEDHRKA
jgi:hypothetical protein